MRDSSLDAYQSILDKLSKKRKEVYHAIKAFKNPPCDKHISLYLNWPINSVTGRRGELEKMGLIESAGRYTSIYSKITVHHWKVSDPEKAIAESKRVKEKPMTFTKEDMIDFCKWRYRLEMNPDRFILYPTVADELTEWINQNK